VSGSLDKIWGRRLHLLLSKRLHLLPPFLSDDPGTAHIIVNNSIRELRFIGPIHTMICISYILIIRAQNELFPVLVFLYSEKATVGKESAGGSNHTNQHEVGYLYFGSIDFLKMNLVLK
jgi:hypothetical protein